MDMLCTFSACPRPVKSLGLCSGHSEQRRTGKTLSQLRTKRSKEQAPAACSFQSCTRPVEGLGLCAAHGKQQRAGRALSPIRAKLPYGSPCSVSGCSGILDSAGLCYRHYSQLPQRRLDSARRKANIRASGFVAKQMLEGIQSADCFYCGRASSRMEADHLIPIERGGTNIWWNLVPACRSCNRKKNDQDPLLWLEKAGKSVSVRGLDVERDVAEQRSRLLDPSRWNDPAPEDSLWRRLGLPETCCARTTDALHLRLEIAHASTRP